jgi:hypothetical protein
MTRRQTWFWLLFVAVLLASVGVRIWLAGSASCIARDGVRYVQMAREIAAGEWRGAIGEDLHAGLPILIWAARGVLGPGQQLFQSDPPMAWQVTGQRVVLVFGVLSIVAVAWLSYVAFGPRVAAVCTLGWAWLPDAMRLSADVLSDVPHIAMAALGLAALLAALQRSSIVWLFVAGLCSGAAYSFRPEGGEVALLAVLLWCLQRQSWRQRGLGAAAVCIGFAVLGGSYILLEGGHVFSKKSPFPAVGVGSWLLAMAQGGTWSEFLLAVFDKWAESLQGVWAVLLVVAFCIRRRPRARLHAAEVLIGILALHLLAVGILWQGYRYVSGRHMLYAVVVTLPVASAGLVGVANGLDHWRRRRGHRPWRRRWDLLMVLVIAAALLPWSLRDIGGGRECVVEAGRWIRQQWPADQPLTILAEHDWVPFYADRFADWAWAEDGRMLLGRLPAGGGVLVVAERLSWLPSEAACRRRGMRLELKQAFEGAAAGRIVLVYQVVFTRPAAESGG